MKNNILVIILVAVFVFLGTYTYFGKQKPISIIKYDTIYTKKDSLIYVPKDHIIYTDTGTHTIIRIPDTFRIPASVDTDAILADYRRVRTYSDTAFKDTIGYVVVNDSVQYNRITSRKTFSNIHVIKEHKIYKPKSIVSIGAGVGYTVDKFGISGKVLYTSPRKVSYGLSYDLINGYVEAAVYFPIRFRKK